jgi:hypothetical protein
MEAEIHLLWPKRSIDLREWQVLDGGKVIGTIEEVKLPHAVSTFFHAYGIHPTTGERVSLELSTDVDERVEVVRAFRADPESSVHYRKWN